MGLISRLLWPTRRLSGYTKVTPDILKADGVTALICDIDNTLVTYDDPVPTPGVIAWLDTMRAAEITVALVSNNTVERVEKFNAPIGLFAIGDSGKPSKKCMRSALEAIGKSPDECAVLGDQVFTDVYAGRRMGMKAYLVPPIKDKRTALFRFKRALEKPILAAYDRKHRDR